MATHIATDASAPPSVQALANDINTQIAQLLAEIAALKKRIAALGG